MLGLFVLMV